MKGSRETRRDQVAETGRLWSGDGRHRAAVGRLWNADLRRAGSARRNRVHTTCCALLSSETAKAKT